MTGGGQQWQDGDDDDRGRIVMVATMTGRG